MKLGYWHTMRQSAGRHMGGLAFVCMSLKSNTESDWVQWQNALLHVWECRTSTTAVPVRDSNCVMHAAPDTALMVQLK